MCFSLSRPHQVGYDFVVVVDVLFTCQILTDSSQVDSSAVCWIADLKLLSGYPQQLAKNGYGWGH